MTPKFQKLMASITNSDAVKVSDKKQHANGMVPHFSISKYQMNCFFCVFRDDLLCCSISNWMSEALKWHDIRFIHSIYLAVCLINWRISKTAIQFGPTMNCAFMIFYIKWFVVNSFNRKWFFCFYNRIIAYKTTTTNVCYIL